MSDLFNTGIRPIIDQYLQTQADEERNYGSYWSASTAGYCYRRQIFERLKVPHVTENARKQRVFSSGHIFHEWIQGITKAAGISIAQELELQDEDLMVRGHIDDLVLVEAKGDEKGIEIDMRFTKKGLQTRPKQSLILYDYKTQHSRSFHYAKGRPMSYYHRLQLATYMYMLRKSHANPEKITEARILKISKDDLCMLEEQLMWSDELSREVNDYWVGLNAYWNNKKMPPCTCHEQENGFLAKEAYNPFFYNDEPCSLDWYRENKVKEESHV